MKYNYTVYAKNEEERNKIVYDDILLEYPNLGELALEAAKMEEPFGRSHEDYDGFAHFENQIFRLINILNVTENKPEYEKEYNKAFIDINVAFNDWKRGYTYANPKEQTASILMQQLNEHLKNPEKPFPSVQKIKEQKKKEYEEETLRQQYIRDHTMKYNYTSHIEDESKRQETIVLDILREYPNLGELALEAAKMEEPFGRSHEDYDGFAHFENQIFRLINILNVTENKPEYEKEYNKAYADINAAFSNWKQGYTYANPEEQTAYILMQKLREHNFDKSIPFPTVQSIKENKKQK